MIHLRPPVAADAGAIGRILFEAFGSIAAEHRFPPDIPTAEFGAQFGGMLIGGPGYFGVVAVEPEEGGGERVVGSNFLDERDAIRGVGPITVDPAFHGCGVGRSLMRAVLDRARETGAVGVRLVQDAFNTVSMPLYASLGSEVEEPLVLLQGKCRDAAPAGAELRPMGAADVQACAELCRRVHGFDRANELRGALAAGFGPQVLARGGRVVAYASSPWFWFVNHGVAETEADLCALLLGASAAAPAPMALLLPTRQASLFRWCLGQGLRITKPLTLMAMGDYREPAGSWFPSVVY